MINHGRLEILHNLGWPEKPGAHYLHVPIRLMTDTHDFKAGRLSRYQMISQPKIPMRSFAGNA